MLNRVAVARLGLLACLGLAAGIVRGQTNFANPGMLAGSWGAVTNDNSNGTSAGPVVIADAAPAHVLWYQWTAPPPGGEVALDTIGSTNAMGLPLDTVLGVYLGASVTTLSQVAANDDLWPLGPSAGQLLTSCQIDDLNHGNTNMDIHFAPNISYDLVGSPMAGPSGLRFNAVANTTYYFAVDAKGATGTIILNWAYHPSGVFRFATEDFYTMPTPWVPLYQAASCEGEGFAEATMVHEYYNFYHFAAGAVVTVTRVAGSSGRMLVNFDTTTPPAVFSTNDIAAVEGTDYTGVHTTLVFDDFEMSKTVVIPITGLGFGGGTGTSNKAFGVVLSSPMPAPAESSDVSAPRVDPFLGSAYVRLLDVNIDPYYDQNFSTNTTVMNGVTNTITTWTDPTNVIVNFGQRHYYIPRDVSSFGNRTTTNPIPINLRIFRGGTNQAAMTLYYRVDNVTGVDPNPPADLSFNSFPLTPESDYAAPTPAGTAQLLENTNHPDFNFITPAFPTGAGGGVQIAFPAGPAQFYDIQFTITNFAEPQFNKDIHVSIYAKDSTGASYQVGTVNECLITILFEDANAPAGSVDENYNADYGLNMVPPLVTVPPEVPNPGADGVVYGVAVQPGDTSIIVGGFSAYDDTPINNIARVNVDGSLDTSFNPGNGANNFIYSIALMDSGQIMIGGAFTTYNGTNRSSVARVNSDGTLDGTFDPGVPGIDGTVWAVGLNTNGEVFIGGDFTAVNGISRPGIALLDTNGALDLSFDSSVNPPNGTVTSLAVANGQVIIGGEFTTVGGRTVNHVARLNADGTPDTTFLANLGSGLDNTVWAVALQLNGSILLGGDFQKANQLPRGRIVRLNSDGSVDTTFNPGTGADDSVYNINPQANGIYVGGLFTSFNGTHRLGFTRLYYDGTVDTGFLDASYNQFAGLHRRYYDKQTPGDPRPAVYSSGVQSDGNVMIAGSFSMVGGGQVDPNIRLDTELPSTYSPYLYWEPKQRSGVRNRSNVARLLGGSTPGPGNLNLFYNSYTLNVGELFLYTTLSRDNGSLGFLAANFAVDPGLAQNGVDYLYFGPTPIYVDVWDYVAPGVRLRSEGFFGQNTLVDDGYGRHWSYGLADPIVYNLNNPSVGNRDTLFQLTNPRGEDQFYLGGANIPVGAALGSSVANFTIINTIINNGPTNYIGFATASFTVNESGTNVLITVIRTNGLAGSPSVSYTTSDGTAIANVNYRPASGRLTFGPGVTNQSFLVPIIDDHISEPQGLYFNLKLTSISSASYGTSNAVVNIIDNDGTPGFVNFSPVNFGANQSAGSVTLTVTRTGADLGTLTAQIYTTNGSAVNGLNYLGLTNTLVWNSLDFSNRYVTIPLTNNGQVGPNLTFFAHLTNTAVNTTNSLLALGPSNSATVTITNDNSYGTLEFSAPIYLVHENGGYATITVIRTGGAVGRLTLNYSTQDGPNAFHTGPNPNYIATSGTLSFNPGVVSTNFTVPILDDGVADPPPTNFYFFVNLSAATPAGVIGFPATAQIQILDAETYDEPAGSPDTTFIPSPGFNGDVYSVGLQTNGQIVAGGSFTSANGAPRAFIARLNSDSTLDTYFLGTSTGANGPINSLVIQSDGQILTGGSFTMMDGVVRGGLARLNNDGSLDSTFTQGAGTDNSLFAMAETFVGTSRRILIGGQFQNVNGTNHPNLARLNNDSSVDGSFDPSLNINGVVYAIAVYPTNTVNGGRILIGGDFTAVDGIGSARIARLNQNGTLDTTFSAFGVSNAVRALAIQYDGRILVGGSFTNFNGTSLNHLARLNADGSLDTTFNVGLGTDDTVDAIALQADSRIVVVGQFLRASGVSRSRITRLLQDGTVDPAINFGAGADSFIDTIAIQPDGMLVIGGDFSEFDGLPRPGLARLYGGAIAGSGSFQFTAGNYDVDENSTNALITVRRTGGTAGNMSISFATSPGTAVPGVNYSNVSATLQFPIGETFQTVVIPVLDDSNITPDLIVNLTLSNPTPPSGLGNQSFGTLTILNDNSGVSFSQTTYSANQNVTGGACFVPLLRAGSLRGTATVGFLTTTNGTAIAGTNYLTVSNTVTFLPGVSNVSVRVPILNDPKTVNDVTVGLELTNANNSLLFSPSLATLTILTTNQAPGKFIFSQTNYMVSEGAGYAAVTVLRTNGHTGTVTVNFATQDDTATAGYKYVATNGILTFVDGDASQTFYVPILQVSQATGNEDFFIVLSNATGGASFGGVTEATVTILDNNIGLHFFTGQEGGIQPATNIYSVAETAGTVALTVERVGTNGITAVNYATANYPTSPAALPGTNYVPTSGTLIFNVGEALKSFSVPVLYDTNVTGDLIFLVNLSNPTNLSGQLPAAQLFAPSVAAVIVQDVNPGVAFTNANFYTYKSATNVLITVVRSNANTGVVSVNYATADGTATQGVDYTSTSGSLTFSNGIVFQSFDVPIINNQLVESNLTFSISLFNPSPSNAVVLAPSTTTVTITNDLAGFRFDSSAYSVDENGVSKSFTVLRTGYTNSTVSVDYTTADGTGRSNVNYRLASGTLVFTNGLTTTNFSVTVIDTGLATGDKTVLLQLQNPVGRAVLANPSAATLTIVDTDGSLIVPSGTALVSGPGGGVLASNQSVTVLFGLRNAAGTNTVNVTATLLATNGVVPTPIGESQSYGALTVHGPSVSRPFTFTPSGTNGQTVAATFQVHDISGPTNQVIFNFTLGTTTALFSNAAYITIPDHGAATPYPSTINVGNLPGQVTKATVMLTNLNHTWPSDIDILLVSPAGSETYLMAKCGGSYTVNNATLTFDDAAAGPLPTTQIVSGTYRPTSYAQAPPPFPVPAPPPIASPTPHYNTNLASFIGNNPNGLWSLFVFDDTPLNSGNISNGWALSLTTAAAVSGASDVGLTMAANMPNVVQSNDVQFTIFLTNYGPSVANNVVVTNLLPAGTVFLSDTPSLGSVSTNGAGLLVWSAGTLAVSASASLTFTVEADVVGAITNSAAVSTSTIDPNPDDASASAVVNVLAPAADLVMTGLASIPNVLQPPGNLTYTLVVTITNAGPALAPQTVIAATLPPGVNFVSTSVGTNFTTNQTAAGTVVSNSVGSLAVGAQASVSVVAQPTASGTFLNAAICSSAITDPFKANNSLPDVKTVVEAPPPPSLGAIALSGANVVLQGSNGLPGWSYIVQTSTNATTPAPTWTPVATGKFDASGNFSVTIPNAVNLGTAARFYRIEVP